jgi:hypothetical protein
MSSLVWRSLYLRFRANYRDLHAFRLPLANGSVALVKHLINVNQLMYEHAIANAFVLYSS